MIYNKDGLYFNDKTKKYVYLSLDFELTCNVCKKVIQYKGFWFDDYFIVKRRGLTVNCTKFRRLFVCLTCVEIAKKKLIGNYGHSNVFSIKESINHEECEPTPILEPEFKVCKGDNLSDVLYGVIIDNTRLAGRPGCTFDIQDKRNRILITELKDEEAQTKLWRDLKLKDIRQLTNQQLDIYLEGIKQSVPLLKHDEKKKLTTKKKRENITANLLPP